MDLTINCTHPVLVYFSNDKWFNIYIQIIINVLHKHTPDYDQIYKFLMKSNCRDKIQLKIR